MKKIFILIFTLILLTTILCGCGLKKNEEGNKITGHYTILFEEKNYFGTFYYLYDNYTRIVYVMVRSGHKMGITPYYIIGKNGEPIIAIYGQNYFEGERLQE